MAIKNFDVLYKTQALEASEKQQVLSNIGAFSGNYDDLAGKPDLSGYATTTALSTMDNVKVDKVAGKALSSNDFTDDLKNKLDGIDDDAEVNIIDEIKVNGTAVTVENKSVSLTVPNYTAFDGSANGLVPKPPEIETVGARIMTDNGTWVAMPEGKTYTQGNGIVISGTTVSVKAGSGVVVDTDGVSVNGANLVQGSGISLDEKEDGSLEISATGDTNVIEKIQAGGSDLPITDKTVNIQVFSTDSTKPGLVPAVDSNTGKYLKGDGTWGTPASIKHAYFKNGDTIDAKELVNSSNSTLYIPTFTTSGMSYGVVTSPTSATGKFLKDDGTWDTPSGASVEGGDAIEVTEDGKVNVLYGAGLTIGEDNKLCASAGSTYNVELDSADKTVTVTETDETSEAGDITKKSFDVKLMLVTADNDVTDPDDITKTLGKGLKFGEKTIDEKTYKLLGIDTDVIATTANVRNYCVMKWGDTMSGDLSLEKNLNIKSSTSGEGDEATKTLGKILMYADEDSVSASFYGLDTKGGIAVGDYTNYAIQSVMVRRKAENMDNNPRVLGDMTVDSTGHLVFRQKSGQNITDCNLEDMTLLFGKIGSSYEAKFKEGATAYNIIRGSDATNPIKYQSIVTEKPTSNIVEGMIYFVME